MITITTANGTVTTSEACKTSYVYTFKKSKPLDISKPEKGKLKPFSVAFHDWKGERFEITVFAACHRWAKHKAWQWVEKTLGKNSGVKYAGWCEQVYLKDIIAKALAEN